MSHAATGGRFFDANGQLRDGRNFAEATGGWGALGLLRLSMELAGQEHTLRPYEENVFVRAAIKALSYGIQQLRFGLWTGPAEDRDATEIKGATGREFLRLLSNPHKHITASQLWHRQIVGDALDGEVFWFVGNEDGEPVKGSDDTGEWLTAPAQFIPVRGSYVLHDEDDDGFVRSYRYQRPSQRGGMRLSEKEWPWYSVVAFTDYDPDNENRGLGDAQAALRAIDIHHQILRYMDGLLENGGQPGGFVTYKNQVDPTELRRREDEAADKMSEPNAGRFWFLDNDARFTPNGVDPKDMEYALLWDRMTQAILTSLGVPPPVVGLYEDATLANVDAAHIECWRGPNGILSRGRRQAAVIRETIFLQRAIRVWPGVEGAFPRFDTSGVEVLRQDKKDQVLAAKDVAAAGVGVTFHEALEIQGCEHHPTVHGDRSWITAGLSEISANGDIKEREKPSDAMIAEAKASTVAKPAATTGGKKAAATARVEGLIVRSGRLQERVARVLDAYGRAAIAQVRRVAKGEAVKSNILDAKIGGWLFKRRIEWERAFGIAEREAERYGLDDPLALVDLSDEEFEELILAEAPWVARFDRDTRVVLRGIFIEAALEAQGIVGGPIVTKSHPDALKFLSRQQVRLSEGVTSRLSTRVRNLVARVLAGAELDAGLTLREAIAQELPALTQSLERVFGTNEARAATIAQTESGIAENGGRWTQFGASGVTEIQWETSRDGAVRPTHAALEGKRSKYGVPFANGLLYPHDPQGTPGEVINCRCTFRATKFKNPDKEEDQ